MIKKKMKNIPRITPFERTHANAVGKFLSEGIDPLTVRQQDAGGEHRYTYKHIAHYYEMTKRKFAFNIAYHTLIQEGKHYERRQVLT